MLSAPAAAASLPPSSMAQRPHPNIQQQQHQKPFLQCKTNPWSGYSVAWSPFFPDKLAVASSANFGLVGNGRLHLMSTKPPLQPQGLQGSLQVERHYDSQDGMYDLAWSEIHENQLVTVCGDGSVKLWDLTLQGYPVRSWKEHGREIFSVDWSNIRKDTFATSSWDHTIKLWHPERNQSLSTIQAHSGCVYSAVFSPHQDNTLASCSSDGLLKIWNMSQPQQAQLTVPAHPTEVLSLAWNYYVPHLIATGSVDRTIKIHDIRMASSSTSASLPASSPSTVATLLGHEFAVRRVSFSPYSATLLGSASYDMTARVWEITPGPSGDNSMMKWGPAGMGGGTMRQIHDAHTEFVFGLAWSLYDQGSFATTSWDCSTHIVGL